MTATAPHPSAPDADVDAVARILGGNVEAFRELVERHQAGILRFVRNAASRSAAHEDLAQDIFVAAFVGLPSFDATRGSFAGWLFAIARNRCINDGKRKGRLPLADPPALIAPTTPADDLAHADLCRRLDVALDALPEEQRTCFVLEEIVGLSPGQIAEVEGVAVGTIRSRLSRAKTRLRAAVIDGEKP